MSRLRFTVRRLMIAVAVLAILAAAFAEFQRIQRRAVFFDHEIATNARLAATFQIRARQFEEAAKNRRIDPYEKPTDPAARFEEDAKAQVKIARYYDALTTKYQDAADAPWRSVEPDGPRPPGADTPIPVAQQIENPMRRP